jgi:hypothetical protein
VGSSIVQGGGKRRGAGCDARPALINANGRYCGFGSGFIM